MQTTRSVVFAIAWEPFGGGSIASAVSFGSTLTLGRAAALAARLSLAPAAALTASRTRTSASLRKRGVSARGLAMMSMAPASSACSSVSEPSSVSDEQMITGIGRCAMIRRRKVMPSIRGISTSRTMTSGTSSWIRRAATKGSEAVAITSISGGSFRISVMTRRTAAESSTISTRIGLLRMGIAPLFAQRLWKTVTDTGFRAWCSSPQMQSEWPTNRKPPGRRCPASRWITACWFAASK